MHLRCEPVEQGILSYPDQCLQVIKARATLREEPHEEIINQSVEF